MTNDFVEYWAAARLFLMGSNPYSPAELLATQRVAGWSEPLPLLMWNPPWTLSFIWPVGLFDHDTGQSVWFLLHTLILFVGAQLLWRIYRGPAQQSRYSWLAVLTFAPGYFVLLLGQIGPLVLLGLIIFLAAAERKSWFVAGASLTLVSVKPHLLGLLWLAVVLWACKERCWKIFLGFGVCGSVAAGLPLFFNPQIYSNYAGMFTSVGIIRPLDWATPSLGTMLGELLQIRAMWIRWVPELVGAAWLIWYWRDHGEGWVWADRLPLILLVSVVSASFVWTFDHIVLLPALVQCAVWLAGGPLLGPSRLLFFLYLGVNAILLVGKIYIRDDFWYFWAAPTFLVLYLCLRANQVSPYRISS